MAGALSSCLTTPAGWLPRPLQLLAGFLQTAMTLMRIVPLIIFWVKSRFLAGTERAKVSRAGCVGGMLCVFKEPGEQSPLGAAHNILGKCSSFSWCNSFLHRRSLLRAEPAVAGPDHELRHAVSLLLCGWAGVPPARSPRHELMPALMSLLLCPRAQGPR